MAALLFVAGDQSQVRFPRILSSFVAIAVVLMAVQVGKTTVCLGLLGAILKQPGIAPSDVAYIKPATQCESEQLIARFCRANGSSTIARAPAIRAVQ